MLFLIEITENVFSNLNNKKVLYGLNVSLGHIKLSLSLQTLLLHLYAPVMRPAAKSNHKMGINLPLTLLALS
jgi:hypothetical protein